MIAWDEQSHGADWHLELDRALLLPERLVGGRVRITADHALEARGLVVTLRAEEHWRHRETTSIHASGEPDISSPFRGG